MSKTSSSSETSFRFSAEQRAGLLARSETEIGAGAASDPDNPPVSDDRLRRMAVAREVRRIREATGLSQPQFAARFRIGLGRLRDFEQARSEPDLLIQAMYALIHQEPARAEALINSIEQHGLSAA